MVRTVQTGANEVVHGRVDNDEVLCFTGFLVQRLGHEDAGVPDDDTARFHDQC